MIPYFPFAEYWWFYLSFTAGAIVLLLIDLGIFHKHARAISTKESIVFSLMWISLALTFNYCLYKYFQSHFSSYPDGAEISRTLALEFLAGYLIEASLSVDNLFVFLIVFKYFGIDQKLQHRVLFYGILGALVFRAIFIGLGSFLMAFHWVEIVFGIILMLTGLKLFFAPNEQQDLSKNKTLKFLNNRLPVTSDFRGQNFFVIENGKRYVTPLFIALLFIEVSDIVFAIDSVPAIFAITKEPLIVFTSNVFAILGLRSLYFLLASALHRFHLLKYGLGIILTFVGAKMTFLNELAGGKFPIGISLSIIGSVLLMSVVVSLIFPSDSHKNP